MKLQVALDELTIPEGIGLISQVRRYVDIVEIGTPLVIGEGMHAVRDFHREFPDLAILADTKIADAGRYEASIAFKAGARYVTVLGMADLGTIQGCLEACDEYGGEVVVDMIGVPHAGSRIAELEGIGVRNIAVHTGVDLQARGRTPLDDLKAMRPLAKRSRVSVAGGINSQTVGDYLKAGADVVIVGGGIAHAPNPATEAESLAKSIHKAK